MTRKTRSQRSGWTGLRATAASLLAVATPLPVGAQPEWRAPPPACIASGPSAIDPTVDLCISQASYARDLCTAIEDFSQANGLPADFFARLIWRESLFRADAVSPKGAEGIAQFMPGTARLRGLRNSFDPIEALRKSAEYLDELRDRFGNLGLAAAAYNAGEARLAGFLNDGGLPYETRDYVLAITAHPAEDWRDNPPADAGASLDKDKPFIDACVALASTRRLKGPVFVQEGPWAPWGAQLAAHFQKSVAQRLFLNVVGKMPAPLNAEKPLIQRERNRSFGSRPRYTARIARQTRTEAETVCTAVRKNGGACIVFKN